MITTVTLNPAIDRTVTLERFAYGSVNRAQSVREDMGGKGINVAKVLKSLGSETKAIGFLGEDNIDHVYALLKNEAIPLDFIMVKGSTRTNLKLIEASTRTTTDVNEAGFQVGSDDIAALSEKLLAVAPKSDYVVFSGSMPAGTSPNLYRTLMTSIADQTKTILDAEGEMLLSGLEAKPFLIKPNQLELETALGTKLDSREKIVEASRSLIRQYGITYVLLSMGGEGSILISEQEAWFAEALKVEVKGTVGAGDSMLAGFLHGLTRGISPDQALAWATGCGALAVSMQGTQTFRKEDVETLLDQVKIHPIL